MRAVDVAPHFRSTARSYQPGDGGAKRRATKIWRRRCARLSSAWLVASALACGASAEVEAAHANSVVGDGVSTQLASFTTLPPQVAQLADDQLVDAAGNPIALHGFSWFGFNNGGTMVDGLWGADPVGSDFANAVWRQKLLGFNAVRLPFSFKDMKLPPRNFTSSCGAAAKLEVVQAVMDPQMAAIDASLAPPLMAPPLRQSGMCNDYLPNSSTLDRLVYVVNFYLNNGFYVLLDNHLREDSTALDNVADWAAQWAALVQRVMQDPAASGRVFFDILNEPDEFGLAWEKTAQKPGIHDLYLQAMDAIWTVSQSAVFLLEGAGQAALGTNWGDGFCTDAATLSRLGLSDPRPFLTELRARPYAQRVVLAPHVYGPAVTTATSGFSGQSLFDRLNSSFGSLTRQGFCIGSKCQKFPVAVGEFGSTFLPANDVTFMADFATYLNQEGTAADAAHKKIVNWFYWAWNSNSGDTGGLVDTDWRTTQWVKVRYLQNRLGLSPWWSAARAEGQPGKQQAIPSPTSTLAPATVSASATATGAEAGPISASLATASTPAVAKSNPQLPPSAAAAMPSPVATPRVGPLPSLASAAVPTSAAAPTGRLQPTSPAAIAPPANAASAAASAVVAAPSAGTFRCEVRAKVDNSWQVGEGYAASLNLYITNSGSVAMTAPFSIAIVGSGYRAVLGSWNMDKPLLNGNTISAVASQSWQSLSPQRGNSVNLGLTLQADLNDFFPRQVVVQGVTCQLLKGA